MHEILKGSGELPDAESVNDKLILHRRFDPFSGDYKAFVRCLDGIAPVQAYFTPAVTPDIGKAPEDIREQWVGLRLPVRSKEYNEEAGEAGFVVRAREALEILKEERPEVHSWWREHYIMDRQATNRRRKMRQVPQSGYPQDWESIPDSIPSNPEFPEYVANLDWFIFLPKWGVAIPEPEFRDGLLANEPLMKPATERE